MMTMMTQIHLHTHCVPHTSPETRAPRVSLPCAAAARTSKKVSNDIPRHTRVRVGDHQRLRWETADEWRFRQFARKMSKTTCANKVPSCESPHRPSCALATPCQRAPTNQNGPYERSVAFWQSVTVAARWSEQSVSNGSYPYRIHPKLTERGIECAGLIGRRPLPYLTLHNSTLGPRRFAPRQLATHLSSVGLKRVVLVGDSLMRYIFAAVVGEYCGEPLDPMCKLSGPTKGQCRHTLTAGGASIAYCDGIHLQHATAGDLLGGYRHSETHIIYRATADMSEAAQPHLRDTRARNRELKRRVVDFFKRSVVGIRASIMSPTPCGYSGHVEYNPLGDRNDGPLHAALVHELACELNLPLVDLWPLEITCASQGRAPNHMNVHYCLPGIPDIEWQLLLQFFAAFTDLRVAAAHNNATCNCPDIDLLTCGNHRRLCAVDANAERVGRLGAMNSRVTSGFERRSPRALAELCGNNSCHDPASVIRDPHLVKAPHQPQRSCINVCLP